MKETLKVIGMSCGHCEAAVKNAILELDQEAQVDIDRAAGQVQVNSSAAREAVVAAIRELGYTVAEAGA